MSPYTLLLLVCWSASWCSTNAVWTPPKAARNVEDLEEANPPSRRLQAWWLSMLPSWLLPNHGHDSDGSTSPLVVLKKAKVPLGNREFDQFKMKKTGRFFYEFKPDSYDENAAGTNYVIIHLHGAFFPAKSTIPLRTFSQLVDWSAERDDLLYIAPNSKYFVWRDVSYRRSAMRKDVTFIEDVVAWAVAERGVSPDRVYLSGSSNGATMVYTMLLESPGLVSAAAPLLSNLPKSYQKHGLPDPVPTPMFLMQSLDDDIHKAKGGLTVAVGGNMQTLSQTATLDVMLVYNNANRTSVDMGIPDPLPDDDDDCSIAEKLYAATAASNSAPVLLLVIDGAGHSVPLLGESTSTRCGDANGMALIIDFFESLQL